MRPAVQLYKGLTRIEMKICGIICEYNPFHNGHAYLIERAKRESGCDALVCIMSGSFTQRGEIALLDKYTRAKHAVYAGADAVLELPTVFAISPAEIFAKGAVKILASIPVFDTLAFGCERDEKALFLSAARATAAESAEQKKVLRARLRTGESLTKARTESLEQTGRRDLAEFLRSPNNILGTEYQKAIEFFGCRAQILPIRRTGASHGSTDLGEKFSSAAAIRAAARGGRLHEAKPPVPPYVFDDMLRFTDGSLFQEIAHSAALTADAKTLAEIVDCTEGLENRIKTYAREAEDFDDLIAKVTTKRYISSRIRRILTAAVLGIPKTLVHGALQSPLYLKPLALRKSTADTLLRELGRAEFPLLARQNDLNTLGETARAVYAKDLLATDIYRFCSKMPIREQMLPIIADRIQ